MRAQWRRLTPANRKLITCKLPLEVRQRHPVRRSENGPRRPVVGAAWRRFQEVELSERPAESRLAGHAAPVRIGLTRAGQRPEFEATFSLVGPDRLAEQPAIYK